MPDIRELVGEILDRALRELEAQSFPLYTFAFYHDHESSALSVCADTRDNSDRVVQNINAYNLKHFEQALASGDLDDLRLWSANVGRSFSLGDFALVNLARTGIEQTFEDLYLSMIRAVVDRHSRIASLASSPEDVVLTCSGPDDEVQFAWSLGAIGEA